MKDFLTNFSSKKILENRCKMFFLWMCPWVWYGLNTLFVCNLNDLIFNSRILFVIRLIPFNFYFFSFFTLNCFIWYSTSSISNMNHSICNSNLDQIQIENLRMEFEFQITIEMFWITSEKGQDKGGIFGVISNFQTRLWRYLLWMISTYRICNVRSKRFDWE